jgi:hypothetical protein
LTTGTLAAVARGEAFLLQGGDCAVPRPSGSGQCGCCSAGDVTCPG